MDAVLVTVASVPLMFACPLNPVLGVLSTSLHSAQPAVV
jgi:hypothetical protein